MVRVLFLVAFLVMIPLVSGIDSLDLSTDPASWNLWGQDALDSFGFHVHGGDVNGDGVADAIVGVETGTSSTTGLSQAGFVQVFFGRNGSFAADHNTVTTPANVTFHAADADDGLGQDVYSADINGDGIDDVIAAAIDADGPTNANARAGEVLIYFGRPSWTAEYLAGEANVTIRGTAANDLLGAEVSAGDIDDDGIADLLLGAAEQVYVFYGSSSWQATLTKADANISFFGSADQVGTNSQLAAADIDDDGIDDVLIGARLGDGPDDVVSNAGEIEVFYGRERASWNASYFLPVDADTVFYGTSVSAVVGSSIAMHDVNADGLLDVSTNWGTGVITWVNNGSWPGEVVDSAAAVNITCAHTGCAGIDRLVAGDFNGDGNSDYLIGADFANGPTGSRSSSGAAFVVLSRENMSGSIVSFNASIWGADASDILGRVIWADDLDGDGLDDAILGAENAHSINNTRFSAGEVRIVSGEVISFANRLKNDVGDVTVSGVSELNVTVDGEPFAANSIHVGVKSVAFFDGSTLMMNVSHNFSRSFLDLANVTINRTADAVVVRVPDAVETKQLVLAQGDNTRLCVDNTPIISADDISLGCTEIGEILFSITECQSSAVKDGIMCEFINGSFVVSGLSHSGIEGSETPPVPEFSTVALGALLVVTIAGFFVVRKGR